MNLRKICIGVCVILCMMSIIVGLYVFSENVYNGDGTEIRRHNSYIDQPSTFDPTRTTIVGLNSNKSHGKIYTVLFYKPIPFFWFTYHETMFHHCDYSNCVATNSNRSLRTASAIVFNFYNRHIQTVPKTPPIIPGRRNPDQAWIFMGHEAPIALADEFRSKSWNNALNWSMTYRLTSDIYLGYGRLTRRTVLPTRNYHAIYRRKTKMAAWLVGHCETQSKREVFVDDLKKYGVKVDIFGKCGEGKVDDVGGFLDPYKFYLALENSFCKDYVTEKFFGRYNHDVILVARGGADYNMMPAGAIINSGNFNGTQELARHLLALDKDKDAYIEMLRRKDVYKAEASTRQFQMPHGLCELCEKLNYLEQNRKTYSDVYGYLHNDQCWDPPDIVY